MKRIRIIYIIQSIGGLNSYLQNLSSYLDPNKFELIMIHGRSDPVCEYINREGFYWLQYKLPIKREINVFLDFYSLFKIFKIVNYHKPDIIHCHSAKSGLLGRIIGFITGTTTIYTPHAFSFLAYPKRTISGFLILWIEKISKFNTILLGCSKSERAIGIKIVGYRKEKSFYWNNAIPLIENSYCQSMESEYFCTLARPSYQKNLISLIDLFSIVIKKYPTLKLKIVGVGHYSPDKEKVRNHILKLKLNDSIELIDWCSREEAFEYISNSKAYISFSKYEGLPLSVIEAYSLGKAIFLSNTVGNIDAFSKDISFLLPLRNVHKSADIIIDAIEGKSKLEDFSNKSIAYFNENFNISERIKELEILYIDILKKRK